MITFDEALAIIRDAAQPLGSETVPIGSAAGRILAGPVTAAIDSPRADVSAMDGYSLRQSDLAASSVALKVIGESFPGSGWKGTIESGTCVRTFTGAPIPDGADFVVLQEQVRREGDLAHIDAVIGGQTWIRRRAADFAAGDTLVQAGRLIDSALMVAIAGADVAQVQVALKPRLALVATGDELVEPGDARRSKLGVPDSVSRALAAFAVHWGAEVVRRQRIRDELPAMTEAAADAVDAGDIVVVTGGASVGERDFAKTMFEPLGLELLFSKVAIRPGKPAWFGRAGGKLLLGLPGNPTSALVTARLLLTPLLTALQSGPIESALRWEPARLAKPLQPSDSRETFHRATLSLGEATLLPFQESHAQKTLADADVLLRQAANSTGVAAGETVPVLRL